VNVKSLIFMSMTVLSIIGGWLGALVGGGNWLSLPSILGSLVGAFGGIWVGYKLGQYM
jgi:outer membrane lipoprotein SlyB